MNIEQIKHDLILLIAEITETDFYYLEDIREEINYIFSNSQQIKQDLISLIAKVTDAEIPDLDNISEAIEQIFNQ